MKHFSDLINDVVQARIVSQRLDHCDLRLPSGQLLRLYQSDSKAWKTDTLMGHLSEYEVGKTLTVLITHQRSEGGGVYYVNERWVDSDRQEVVLQVGMVVKGRVVAEVFKTQHQLAGYQIQLDPNQDGYQQPDTYVYLPLDEIPWEDGSLSDHPINSSSQRLSLWLDDWVELEVTNLKKLPFYSETSLIKCIHHRDIIFYYSTYTATQYISSDLELEIYDHKQDMPRGFQKPLSNKKIIVVDDTKEKLELLCDLLRKNGAEVYAIQVINGKISLAVKNLYDKIKSDINFELVLVDYALPQPYQGISLIDQAWKLLLDEFSLVDLPKCVLISTYIEQKDIIYARKKISYLKGFLVRPIKIDHLLTIMLGQESEELWRISPYYSDLANLAQPNRPKDLPEIINEIIFQNMANFIILLTIESNGKLSWNTGVGKIPFTLDNLYDLEINSDLAILIRGNYKELIYTASNPDKNDYLLGIHSCKSFWQLVCINSENNYIFGIGYSDKNYNYHLLNKQLIVQCLNDNAWRGWIDHHANFISSGVLVHSLAHEYRNYLNNLNNISVLLELSILNEQLKKIKTLSFQLKEQTQHINELTNILLQGLSHRFNSMRLRDIVNQTELLVKSAFLEQRTILKIGKVPDITLGIPSSILITVLVNLILNGSKHHYRIENRFVYLSVYIENIEGRALLQLIIQDNGPGIHTRNLDKLFKIGYSSANSDDGKHGIGLWLSTELLKKVQGVLWLDENLLGLGCTFKIRIPLHLT